MHKPTFFTLVRAGWVLFRADPLRYLLLAIVPGLPVILEVECLEAVQGDIGRVLSTFSAGLAAVWLDSPRQPAFMVPAALRCGGSMLAVVIFMQLPSSIGEWVVDACSNTAYAGIVKAVGCVLFIAYLFVGVRFIQAPALVMRGQLPGEALRNSWHRMRGLSGRCVLLLCGVYVPVVGVVFWQAFTWERVASEAMFFAYLLQLPITGVFCRAADEAARPALGAVEKGDAPLQTLLTRVSRL